MKKTTLLFRISVGLLMLATTQGWAQTLPPEPLNYLEKLSFNEEITSFNKYDNPANLSMSDKRKSLSTLSECTVRLYLLPDSTMAEYRIMDSLRTNPYWKQTKTRVTDQTTIRDYDQNDSLIHRTVISQFDSLTTSGTHHSLGMTFEPIDSAIIDELDSLGFSYTEIATGVHTFTTEEMMMQMNANDSSELFIMFESEQPYYVERKLFQGIGSGKVYPYYESETNKEEFLNGVTGSVIRIVNRDNFTYEVSSGLRGKAVKIENENVSIVVSPIPASNEIIIDLFGTEGLPSNFTLRSLQGELLLQGHNNGNKLALDLTSFASGMYVLSIEHEGQIFTQKITKL